jgi:hypothetical protein
VAEVPVAQTPEALGPFELQSPLILELPPEHAPAENDIPKEVNSGTAYFNCFTNCFIIFPLFVRFIDRLAHR